MAEVTAEERADTLANTECPHWSEAVPFTCRSECPRCVAKEIRSAVAAQKEKDASVDPLSVACPTCSQRKKEFCQSVDDPFAKERPHDARWRAAIRKETS